MSSVNKRFSYQLPKSVAAVLRERASAVGKTPTALVQELITAFCKGTIRLPKPDAFNDVYKD